MKKFLAYILSVIVSSFIWAGIATAEYPSIDLYVSQTEAVLGDTIQISYTVNNPYETEYIMFEITEYWGKMERYFREHNLFGRDPVSTSIEYTVTDPRVERVEIQVSHQTGTTILAYEYEEIQIIQPSGPVSEPIFKVDSNMEKVAPGGTYSATVTLSNTKGNKTVFSQYVYAHFKTVSENSTEPYYSEPTIYKNEIENPEDGKYPFEIKVPPLQETSWDEWTGTSTTTLRTDEPLTVGFILNIDGWEFSVWKYPEFLSQAEINQERKDKTQAFVTRCYNLIMNREAESGGLNYWTGQLTEKTSTASAIIDQFTQSDEFKGRKLSSAAKVDILYNTMLARDPDSAGKAYWVSQLDAGVSESAIINGFCGSEEFAAICADYDIEPGTVAADQPDQPAAEGVQGFVQRCYTKALDRGFDQDGVNYWVEEMQKGLAPQEVAKKFIFSEEAINKGRNNDEFIKTLYRLYMGREADEAGLAYWNEKMAGGMSREQVNDGFAGSEEFAAIVAGFGL